MGLTGGATVKRWGLEKEKARGRSVWAGTGAAGSLEHAPGQVYPWAMDTGHMCVGVTAREAAPWGSHSPCNLECEPVP